LTPDLEVLILATPLGKHDTNFSASESVIGERICIVGSNRYDAVAKHPQCQLRRRMGTVGIMYLRGRILHDLFLLLLLRALKYPFPEISKIGKRRGGRTCPGRSLAIRISSWTGFIGSSLNHAA